MEQNRLERIKKKLEILRKAKNMFEGKFMDKEIQYMKLKNLSTIHNKYRQWISCNHNTDLAQLKLNMGKMRKRIEKEVRGPRTVTRWIKFFKVEHMFSIEDKYVGLTSGNYIVFHDIKSRKEHIHKIGFQETTMGPIVSCAGHKNEPVFSYAAYNADSVLVLSYPSMISISSLKDCQDGQHTAINFGTAETLVVLKGHPSHQMTIWLWRRAEVLFTFSSITQSENTFIRLGVFDSSLALIQPDDSVQLWHIFPSNGSATVFELPNSNDLRLNIADACFSSNNVLYLLDHLSNFYLVESEQEILQLIEWSPSGSEPNTGRPIMKWSFDQFIVNGTNAEIRAYHQNSDDPKDFTVIWSIHLSRSLSHLVVLSSSQAFGFSETDGLVTIDKNELKSHEFYGAVRQIAVLQPNSKYIVASSNLPVLTVWKLSTGVLRTIFDLPEDVDCLAAHPNLPELVCAARTRSKIFFCDLRDLGQISIIREIWLSNSPVRFIRYSPTGENVIVGTLDPILFCIKNKVIESFCRLKKTLSSSVTVNINSVFYIVGLAELENDERSQLIIFDMIGLDVNRVKSLSVKYSSIVESDDLNTFYLNMSDGSAFHKYSITATQENFELELVVSIKIVHLMKSVSLISHGPYLITCGRDGLTMIYSQSHHKCYFIHSQHHSLKGGVKSVVIDNYGKFLVSIGHDGVIVCTKLKRIVRNQNQCKFRPVQRTVGRLQLHLETNCDLICNLRDSAEDYEKGLMPWTEWSEKIRFAEQVNRANKTYSFINAELTSIQDELEEIKIKDEQLNLPGMESSPIDYYLTTETFQEEIAKVPAIREKIEKHYGALVLKYQRQLDIFRNLFWKPYAYRTNAPYFLEGFKRAIVVRNFGLVQLPQKALREFVEIQSNEQLNRFLSSKGAYARNSWIDWYGILTLDETPLVLKDDLKTAISTVIFDCLTSLRFPMRNFQSARETQAHDSPSIDLYNYLKRNLILVLEEDDNDNVEEEESQMGEAKEEEKRSVEDDSDSEDNIKKAIFKAIDNYMEYVEAFAEPDVKTVEINTVEEKHVTDGDATDANEDTTESHFTGVGPAQMQIIFDKWKKLQDFEKQKQIQNFTLNLWRSNLGNSNLTENEMEWIYTLHGSNTGRLLGLGPMYSFPFEISSPLLSSLQCLILQSVIRVMKIVFNENFEQERRLKSKTLETLRQNSIEINEILQDEQCDLSGAPLEGFSLSQGENPGEMFGVTEIKAKPDHTEISVQAKSTSHTVNLSNREEEIEFKRKALEQMMYLADNEEKQKPGRSSTSSIKKPKLADISSKSRTVKSMDILSDAGPTADKIRESMTKIQHDFDSSLGNYKDLRYKIEFNVLSERLKILWLKNKKSAMGRLDDIKQTARQEEQRGQTTLSGLTEALKAAQCHLKQSESLYRKTVDACSDCDSKLKEFIDSCKKLDAAVVKQIHKIYNKRPSHKIDIRNESWQLLYQDFEADREKQKIFNPHCYNYYNALAELDSTYNAQRPADSKIWTYISRCRREKIKLELENLWSRHRMTKDTETLIFLGRQLKLCKSYIKGFKRVQTKCDEYMEKWVECVRLQVCVPNSMVEVSYKGGPQDCENAVLIDKTHVNEANRLLMRAACLTLRKELKFARTTALLKIVETSQHIWHRKVHFLDEETKVIEKFKFLPALRTYLRNKMQNRQDDERPQKDIARHIQAETRRPINKEICTQKENILADIQTEINELEDIFIRSYLQKLMNTMDQNEFEGTNARIYKVKNGNELINNEHFPILIQKLLDQIESDTPPNLQEGDERQINYNLTHILALLLSRSDLVDSNTNSWTNELINAVMWPKANQNISIENLLSNEIKRKIIDLNMKKSVRIDLTCSSVGLEWASVKESNESVPNIRMLTDLAKNVIAGLTKNGTIDLSSIPTDEIVKSINFIPPSVTKANVINLIKTLKTQMNLLIECDVMNGFLTRDVDQKYPNLSVYESAVGEEGYCHLKQQTVSWPNKHRDLNNDKRRKTRFELLMQEKESTLNAVTAQIRALTKDNSSLSEQISDTANSIKELMGKTHEDRKNIVDRWQILKVNSDLQRELNQVSQEIAEMESKLDILLLKKYPTFERDESSAITNL